jgi:hypothetical protein
MDAGFGSRGDFQSDVIRNLVPGYARVAALATRTISTAFASIPSSQDVWPGAAAVYPLPSAGVSLEVVSSSASDAAAGVGAQKVTIDTLDVNYAVIASVVVSLNGVTPVAVPGGAVYFRLNAARTGMVTPDVTARQKNVGDITIRDAGGGTVRGVILAGVGVLQQAIYTVPAGFTLIIHSLECQILSSSGGGLTRGADFMLTFRTSDGGAISPRRIGCTDIQPYLLPAETRIRATEKTDFIASCIYTSSNNMTVGFSFEANLLKN